jgi:hypothetical protein
MDPGFNTASLNDLQVYLFLLLLEFFGWVLPLLELAKATVQLLVPG